MAQGERFQRRRANADNLRIAGKQAGEPRSAEEEQHGQRPHPEQGRAHRKPGRSPRSIRPLGPQRLTGERRRGDAERKAGHEREGHQGEHHPLRGEDGRAQPDHNGRVREKAQRPRQALDEGRQPDLHETLDDVQVGAPALPPQEAQTLSRRGAQQQDRQHGGAGGAADGRGPRGPLNAERREAQVPEDQYVV